MVGAVGLLFLLELPMCLCGDVTISTPSYQYVSLSDYGITMQNRDNVSFYVKGCNDAHVGLLTINSVSKTDIVYEIVIGGWGNTRTALRKGSQSSPRAGVDASTGFLSCNEYRRFYVSFTGRQLSVGNYNGDQPVHLVSYTDSSSKVINYIAVAGWNTVLNWIFSIETTEAETTEISTAVTTEVSTALTTKISTAMTTEVSRAVTTETPGCVCTCVITHTNYTVAELDRRVKEMKKQLQIDKKQTSASIRKRVSAPDDRKSSQTIGYVGIIILVIVFGGIVIIDIPKVFVLVSIIKDNLRDQ